MAKKQTATPPSSKVQRFNESSSDDLELLLLRIHGDDYQAQLPGHYGNGAPDGKVQ
jgi:hypothetical protein